MSERSTVSGMSLLALGLLLAAVSLLPQTGSPWVALALLWLAQPPTALGLALLRRSRQHTDLSRDGLRLALRWFAGFTATGLLLSWPLAQLLHAPTLGKTLLLSGLAGILLATLWWQWPDWHTLEQRGHQPTPRTLQRDAWRGLLQVALPIFLVLTGGLLLAWPGLLSSSAQVPVGIAYIALLVVAHALLQSASPLEKRQGLPIVEMAEPASSQITREDALEALPLAPTSAAQALDTSELDHQLLAAARSGRVDRALALLASGADPNARASANARDRRSLTVLAAVLPDLRLLRALIERGVDVNAAHDGMTPLLAATRDSWHGRPEAVMTLLTNGADPHQTDAEGNTPLHFAARSSDPGVAALLRDAGANLDALNAEGVSPLGSACSAGNWRLARFLLERQAKPQPEGGRPALLLAAANEDDDGAGALLLLRHKANVNACDPRGRSALHEAAAGGNVSICHILLDAGANPNARDSAGRTPLLDAARAGALPVVERLIAAKADVHATDHHQHTALSCAMASGNKALIALLDPQASARMDAYSEVTPELPPQIRLRDALLTGADTRQLLQLRAHTQPHELDSLLQDPDITQSPAHIAWLLAQGANPDVHSPGHSTPVFTALAQGAEGIRTLSALFAGGASPAGAGGLARFLSACLAQQHTAPRSEAFALGLLSRGADPFAADENGAPPLPLAVRLGWTRLLERLLVLGADPDGCDARGMTGLHIATEQQQLSAVQLLLTFGASPHRRAADGQSPLGIALASGQPELIEWLDWRLWPLPHRPLLASDLPAAAIIGDLDAVRRLLALGFPIDSTDQQGCTALLRAAGCGHLALVEFLLAQGANPGLAAKTGATPLSAAVSKQQLDIVAKLLDAGCGLEQRLPGELTVLMLAAALGLPDLVSRLLQAGADVHVRDAQGLNPMHWAAQYGFTSRDRTRLLALFDVLLLAGADPSSGSKTGVTPLLFLLGSKAEPGTPSNDDILVAATERLLDEDIPVNAQDAQGTTALHLAALHGLQRVAQALLTAGATPGLCDNARRTAHDIALARGYMEIASDLSAPSTPTSHVSMARFLRD